MARRTDATVGYASCGGDPTCSQATQLAVAVGKWSRATQCSRSSCSTQTTQTAVALKCSESQTEARISAHAAVDADVLVPGSRGFCKTCCKFFVSQPVADKHWRLVHAAEPLVRPAGKYPCSYCPFSSDTLAIVQDHENCHTGNKPYCCRFCPKRYSCRTSLRTHHKRQHINKDAHACDTCHKCFASKLRLESHLRQHTGEKPYSCRFCSKQYHRSDSLRNHERTHTTKVRHVCSVCGKSFTRKVDLDAHELAHSDVKPFACQLCPKRYRRKASLVLHQKTHTAAGRTVTCGVCQRGFFRPSDLVIHQRVHTGEKPYPCKFCEKRFSQKGYAATHERGHTGE